MFWCFVELMILTYFEHILTCPRFRDDDLVAPFVWGSFSEPFVMIHTWGDDCLQELARARSALTKCERSSKCQHWVLSCFILTVYLLLTSTLKFILMSHKILQVQHDRSKNSSEDRRIKVMDCDTYDYFEELMKAAVFQEDKEAPQSSNCLNWR